MEDRPRSYFVGTVSLQEGDSSWLWTIAQIACHAERTGVPDKPDSGLAGWWSEASLSR